MAERNSRETSREAIGRRIRLMREGLGINQTDFAESIDTISQNVGPWEKGETRPALDWARRIKRRYQVTLDWIYDGDDALLPKRILDAVRLAEQRETEQRKKRSS